MPRINANLRLTLKELVRNLPVGPGWFSESAVKDGEVGKLLKSLSLPVGELLDQVRDSRDGIYLASATGDDLDQWGRDLLITRSSGELDTPYRDRLINEVIGSKLTIPAMEDYIYSNLGIQTTIYEPWRDLDWREETFRLTNPNTFYNPKAGRSGTTRRSSYYYTAGVIEVITDGWHKDIKPIINTIKAAHIKPYFTTRIAGGHGIIDDEDPEVTTNTRVYYIGFVPPYTQNPTYSGYGQILSGGPRTRMTNTVVHKKLKNDSSGLQQKLFNAPLVANLDFRATSQTWESVADLTWNQLLDSHERQTPASIRTNNISQLYGAGTYGSATYG